jgi:hypothetical protein
VKIVAIQFLRLGQIAQARLDGQLTHLEYLKLYALERFLLREAPPKVRYASAQLKKEMGYGKEDSPGV